MTNKFRDRAALMAMQGAPKALEALDRLERRYSLHVKNEQMSTKAMIETIRESLQSMQWREDEEIKKGVKLILDVLDTNGDPENLERQLNFRPEIKAVREFVSPPAPQGDE